MRFVLLIIVTSICMAGGTAHAGEEVLYGPPPEWVEVYDSERIDQTAKTPLALFDVQQRIEDGTLTTFVDQALKLESPQALTQAGTTTATWLPDKGDLTMHKVEILRGKDVIDVLTGDHQFTVLRRETQLERRTLDGALTATLAVPGLRIGDILRVSYSQTTNDPTLQGEVQLTVPLFAKPVEAGFARQKVSWPVEEKVRWKAGPDVSGAIESVDGAYRILTIPLPLAKREELPMDAPSRYLRGPMLQAGTFSDWRQVSQIFAPLYATDGAIARGSPLAREVKRIMEASADPVERAALATRLVQDKVSYLMNGMATGNYVPQAPASTWEFRYGDCKAKTLLLLSLLDAMGIAAEPVLVNSRISDAVLEMLPIPGAFDHVLVRADIDGTAYWLDGTSSGTRLASVADTPPFRIGLPIRADGAELLEIEARVPAVPQVEVDMLLDNRGGVDLPSLVTVRAHLSGALGSSLGSAVEQASEQQKKELVKRFARSLFSDMAVSGGSLVRDEETGITEVEFTGIVSSRWEARGARKRLVLDGLASAELSFEPDRARPAWREIPVNLGFAGYQVNRMRLLLPDDESGYELQGRPDLDGTFARTRVIRHGKLEGHVVEVDERLESLGGELPSAEIAAERGKAARIANSSPYLLSPPDAARKWEYGRPELRARVKPYEKAYALAIEREPDEAVSYINRGWFRFSTTNLEGALADYSKAIELDPDPGYYGVRAKIYWAIGQSELALADYRKAFELAPSQDTAIDLANMLGQLGETEEALALVDDFDDYGDKHASFVQIRADILAHAGRADEGLTEIDALIEEQPGQGHLFNSSCWYRARFGVGTDRMIEMCNKAVEQAGMASAALDSRALAWLRLGEMEKAKSDADAALALAPGQAITHYVRAFALRGLRDRSAEDVITYFVQTWPGEAQAYK